MESQTFDPFAPAKLGPIEVRNRFVKAATFEGMAKGNTITPELIAFHQRVANGGVGVSTLAYCAVSMDGRGAPNEVVVREEIRPALQEFAEAIRAIGATPSMQLGHAGPVGAGAGSGGLSPSRVFAPQALRFTKAALVSDLERIAQDFVKAAEIAVESGFGVLELHFGHNYLISAFLSPKLNRRKDEFGGSIENRARLGRDIAKRVRDAVGDRAAVIAKLNMDDGVKGGLRIAESLEVAKLLEQDGALDALELSGGSSFSNPMFLFKGEAPVDEMAKAFPQPLRTGFKLGAGRFLKEYPFEEAYFLPYARQYRDALSMPLILLGGVNKLETVHTALGLGFEFVALGRALLREPDLLARWEKGQADEGLCIHCNKCMATIYHREGTHCWLNPQ